MSKYVDRVIAEVEKKYADEPEFVQTVEEVLSSLGPVVDAQATAFSSTAPLDRTRAAYVLLRL